MAVLEDIDRVGSKIVRYEYGKQYGKHLYPMSETKKRGLCLLKKLNKLEMN